MRHSLVVALTLVGCGPDRLARVRSLPGDPVNGVQLIEAHCAGCHLDGLTCQVTGDQVAKAILFGSWRMRPVSELSDQQAADVAAVFDGCVDGGMPDGGP